MSANVTATFTDYTPGHLRRKMQQPAAVTDNASVLSDMADGNLVTEFFFKFANFDHAASNLVLTIIGILGDGEQSIKLFDEEIANVAKCHDRTVRRWRVEYLAQAQKQNFFPLEVIEGEYDHTTQRYKATSYRITFADALEQAVATARARPEYKTDRRAAIEKAAEIYYDDIPQAPSRMRTRKPRKAAQTPLAHLNGAAKKLMSAQTSLKDMPSRQRDAFISGQGEELRGMLEALRQQIAELESCLETGETENTSVENKEVETVWTFCPVSPPPDEETKVDVRVKEEETRTPTEEPEHVHTPEDFAAWDRTFGCLSRPKVVHTEVEVKTRSPEESPPPSELEYCFDDLPDEPACFTENDIMSDLNSTIMEDLPPDETDEERAEREAIAAEACGLMPRYEIGAQVFPVTITGERLHDEPSPVAEVRSSPSGWQYRLEGFSEWRDEGLLRE